MLTNSELRECVARWRAKGALVLLFWPDGGRVDTRGAIPLLAMADYIVALEPDGGGRITKSQD